MVAKFWKYGPREEQSVKQRVVALIGDVQRKYPGKHWLQPVSEVMQSIQSGTAHSARIKRILVMRERELSRDQAIEHITLTLACGVVQLDSVFEPIVIVLTIDGRKNFGLICSLTWWTSISIACSIEKRCIHTVKTCVWISNSCLCVISWLLALTTWVRSNNKWQSIAQYSRGSRYSRMVVHPTKSTTIGNIQCKGLSISQDTACKRWVKLKWPRTNAHWAWVTIIQQKLTSIHCGGEW